MLTICTVLHTITPERETCERPSGGREVFNRHPYMYLFYVRTVENLCWHVVDRNAQLQLGIIWIYAGFRLASQSGFAAIYGRLRRLQASHVGTLRIDTRFWHFLFSFWWIVGGYFWFFVLVFFWYHYRCCYCLSRRCFSNRDGGVALYCGFFYRHVK